jgi:hypothetical protein
MAIIVLEDIAISYSGPRFRFYSSLFSLSEKLLRRFQGSISSWEPVVFSIRNVSKWRRTKAWSVSSQLAVEMIHYQLRSLMAPDPYAKQCFTVHEGASPSNHRGCDIHQPLHTVSGYYNLTDLGQPQLISDPKDALVSRRIAGEISFSTQISGRPYLKTTAALIGSR